MGWLQAWLARWGEREALRFPAGLAAWHKYVRDTLAELSIAREHEWTVLLYERRLPHGDVRWIRAEVTAARPPRISVSVRSSNPAAERSANPLGKPPASTAEEGTTLATLIQGAIGEDRGSSEGSSARVGDAQSVKDGHRCTLVVIGANGIRLREEVLVSLVEAPSGASTCLCATVVALADRSA